MRVVTFVPTFAGWQAAARAALIAGEPPEALLWQELGADQPTLDLAPEFPPAPPRDAPRDAPRVPRAFVALARSVADHRSPDRWSRLYRVLWRLTHGEPRLLEITVDPDIDTIARMDKALRRDVHKMRAFVRFREVTADDGAPWFVAWFEPEHHIVERNAPFFIDRFAGMRWSILTPDRCAHWDGAEIRFTPGVPRSAAPGEDATEDLWRTYYANIFNPARVKTHAMQAEMPKKYWRNLPEAALIPSLLEAAPKRVETMVAHSQTRARAVATAEWRPAEPPRTDDLAVLRDAAATCTACPLYRDATQTVFGEGPPDATVVFVGEQPGDQEDRAGRPFVGPAGKLLDRALVEAGVDRATVYVTNAVKHFKWEPRGKRRLHKTPGARDIAACRPWLEAELAALRPRVLVCLGGTAAQSVLGPDVRVTHDRGRVQASDFCAQTVITVHPSSLLRAPDEAAREAGYRQFVEDLRTVAGLIP